MRPATPSGPEGIEAVPGTAAEGLAQVEMPAAESMPLQVVVTALIHCSDLGTPAPLGPLEAKRAPPLAMCQSSTCQSYYLSA